MGYAHSYHQTRDLTDTEWRAVTADAEALIALARADGLEIVDGSGLPGTEPVIDAEQIRFNGAMTPDHGLETFRVTRTLDITTPPYTTKTGRQPYDRVVTAMICLLAHHVPRAFDIRSNGGPGDWQAGLSLARQVRSRVRLPRGVAERAA